MLSCNTDIAISIHVYLIFDYLLDYMYSNWNQFGYSAHVIESVLTFVNTRNKAQYNIVAIQTNKGLPSLKNEFRSQWC